MDIYVLTANILSVLAFFVHTFVGDREIRFLEPTPEREKGIKRRAIWTMSRCGWHWISWDLLFASVLMALLNFWDYFSNEMEIKQVLTFYFLGYGIVWLLTILISRKFPKNILYLGQWILLLSIAGLLHFAKG